MVRLVNCGHPPPLRLSPDGVTELHPSDPGLPLNLGVLLGTEYCVDVVPFRPGDLLLLYTDGVTETRDADGDFYPLHERIRSWTSLPPSDLLARLHQDLVDYSDGHLDDDIAALAAYRLPEDPVGGSSPT